MSSSNLLEKMISIKSEDEIEISNENRDFMKVSGMSPITDLALNMKSLTTSLSGTPARCISWSNAFPCDSSSKKFSENLSPSIDSPTFQEISYKIKKKSKLRKVLQSDSEDDKENISPVNVTSDFILKNNSVSDSLSFKSNTQDSGYSDLSLKNFEMSPSGPSSSTKHSTSIDEIGDDGFEYLLEIEEEEVENMKILTNIRDMSSLLTKPLFPKKNDREILPLRQKLPIRRCLSMEMDVISPSPPIKLELISQTGTLIAAQIEDMNSESLKRGPFKRPEPPGTCLSIQNKRRKSSPSVYLSREIERFSLQRSFSETAATIMQAVQKSDLEPDLIGDCTRCYALPLVNGRHQDLKSISPQTLVQVLQGEFNHEVDNYTLVDCRYPYEFEGGHIQGALNIYSKEDIIKKFLEDSLSPISERNVVIFHCEFSSERAPNLCRFLRNKDREKNESNYPKLHHPEVYILEGGYKAFFHNFKEYCEPQSYKPMNHKDHSFELKHFRAKSKSWGAESKSKYKLKTSSVSKI